jgi:glucose/arabinose dehydrogenase
MGEQYENDMFVADVRGDIYNFKLDRDRTKLLLTGLLKDKLANDFSEVEDSIFAEFPGVITDLKVGPDGYLYVLLFQQGSQEYGGLFRIVPSNT